MVKKVIAVLVIMMVLVGALFADANNEELRISITITPVAPIYKLYGSLTQGSASDGAGMVAGEVVASIHSATSADSIIEFPSNAILSGPVTVYCVIQQTNISRYSSPIDLTVTATNLTDDISTSTATVSTPQGLNNVPDVRTTSGTGAGTLTITYSGRTSAIADIASFNVVYSQADLIPGSYDGYITLTYTTTV